MCSHEEPRLDLTPARITTLSALYPPVQAASELSSTVRQRHWTAAANCSTFALSFSADGAGETRLLPVKTVSGQWQHGDSNQLPADLPSQKLGSKLVISEGSQTFTHKQWRNAHSTPSPCKVSRGWTISDHWTSHTTGSQRKTKLFLLCLFVYIA